MNTINPKNPVQVLMCSAAVGLLGWLAAGPAAAQTADVSKGAALFATHCSECHSTKEGKDKKGPSLFAAFGAKAALREGFAYSDALRGSHLVWTADTLNGYIANPKKVVPGGKMKYDGLDSAAERADLIAFLASINKH
jgi:cytochrome c